MASDADATSDTSAFDQLDAYLAHPYDTGYSAHAASSARSSSNSTAPQQASAHAQGGTRSYKAPDALLNRLRGGSGAARGQRSAPVLASPCTSFGGAAAPAAASKTQRARKDQRGGATATTSPHTRSPAAAPSNSVPRNMERAKRTAVSSSSAEQQRSSRNRGHAARLLERPTNCHRLARQKRGDAHFAKEDAGNEDTACGESDSNAETHIPAHVLHSQQAAETDEETNYGGDDDDDADEGDISSSANDDASHVNSKPVEGLRRQEQSAYRDENPTGTSHSLHNGAEGEREAEDLRYELESVKEELRWLRECIQTLQASDSIAEPKSKPTLAQEQQQPERRAEINAETVRRLYPHLFPSTAGAMGEGNHHSANMKPSLGSAYENVEGGNGKRSCAIAMLEPCSRCTERAQEAGLSIAGGGWLCLNRSDERNLDK